MEAIVVALITSLVVSAVETISIIHLKSSEKSGKESGVDDKEFEDFRSQVTDQLNILKREKDNTLIEYELRDLSRRMDEYIAGSQQSISNIPQIIEVIKRITEKCTILEDRIKSETASSSYRSDDSQRLNELEKQIIELEKIISKLNQQELIPKIKELEQQINELKKTDVKKHDPGIYSQPTTAGKPHPLDMPKPVKDHRSILPDEKYVRKLISEAEKLDVVYAGNYRYGNLMNGLHNILDNGDFDDPEEIMSEVYSVFKEDVYNALKGVKPESVPFLEEYLVRSGFSKADVKVGDSLERTIDYWKDTFPAECSDISKNKCIKCIHEHPYDLYYICDNKENHLVLKGSCTYYNQGE